MISQASESFKGEDCSHDGSLEPMNFEADADQAYFVNLCHVLVSFKKLLLPVLQCKMHSKEFETVKFLPANSRQSGSSERASTPFQQAKKAGL